MRNETEDERAERLLGPSSQALLAAWYRALNPETMFHKPPTQVIDLRRRYNITLRNPFRDHWEAVDLETFDPDPESRWHIVGRGYGLDGSCEAVSDLLERIGAEVAKG